MSLRKKTLDAPRYLSVEQACIITGAWKKSEGRPVIIRRAHALAASLREISINIDPEELLSGNRTPGIRAGVVFPEAGISWLTREIETLPVRPQDPFNVWEEDISIFFNEIVPYWKGRTLEDAVYTSCGDEIQTLEKVVKINQKDHAQGHICPDVSKWLEYGPSGLLAIARSRYGAAEGDKKIFLEAVCIVLEAACDFIMRYAVLAESMIHRGGEDQNQNIYNIARICRKLTAGPPESYSEAVQSVWFLFVMLQMESNASSFSPGRMDQYLYPYYLASRESMGIEEIQEITDALFIRFNHIVYMRNSNSARYFAGFPTGFNITLGGQTPDGKDAVNELSYIFLMAQEHVRLPQPNLSARLYRNSPEKFIDECSRIIGLGTGMPQIVNDESIIPSLMKAGIEREDALDYALVGCVEISPQGNFLGWSDAAMFNMVKVLELTMNDGICMITGEQTGLKTGTLDTYATYDDLEIAFLDQVKHFTERMINACEKVERCHMDHLPSPLLSSVIDDCIDKGVDVTAGGARYNMSGIQAIQVANLADSLAVLKDVVFGKKLIGPARFLEILRSDFQGEHEVVRQMVINKVPKYGNDINYVDELGERWIRIFADILSGYANIRGGRYNMGLYTVSAHVPMGANTGATPDGRHSGDPLADGGLSPMYGRDKAGPTAVLNSVAHIPSGLAPNGTLLNMKFLPSVFENDQDRKKFNGFLKAFTRLTVHHVQFNVITSEELLKAKEDPESYRSLTIRVAGYTAFFTELAPDLQDEIIKRTTHGGE